jgi:hypothetical protein
LLAASWISVGVYGFAIRDSVTFVVVCRFRAPLHPGLLPTGERDQS